MSKLVAKSIKALPELWDNVHFFAKRINLKTKKTYSDNQFVRDAIEEKIRKELKKNDKN
jgi:hypothetical protein